MNQEDIETVELWIDLWSEEIADAQEDDHEMYAEDKKVILAARRIIAYVKADKAGGK